MDKLSQRIKAFGRRPGAAKGLKVRAQAQGRAELLLYDVIGWPWIEARHVAEALQRLGDEPVLARISSPGGDVFEGLAIYNCLRLHHARVDTRVEGLAGSIASIIALAGRTVQAAEPSSFMIHNPYAMVMGDAREFRRAADVLEKIGGQLADVYAAKTGAESQDAQGWMDAETWFTAKEAQEAGLVDQVLGDIDQEARAALARFDLSVFDRVPEDLAAMAGSGAGRERPTEREFERLLREAGFSRSEATGIVANGYRSVVRGEPAEELVAGLKSITDNLRNMTR